MKTFTVKVLIVPTILDKELFGAVNYYTTMTIKGKSLKHAKELAGVQ